ncbi:t-complex protein 1 subunit gamma [Vairimorpha apis BRL 01]|uniref:T-complex protein 1 subunit gamma n=1 Tax=Vairimorpha apis BRL 01 TaxID=1037528 RepID=T0MGN2_9MICR|nr:t-complex protein 1 subunit gamma [Vairimorpha apis BRL 01]
MQNQFPRKVYVLVPDKPYQIQEESANAAMIISSVIKTCLGPKAMQKMVITKINSIEITNDGNSILREFDVSHPSARSIIELARTQDDEVGDGTTTVVILAAEVLNEMSKVLSNGSHPIRYKKIIKSSIETKLCNLLKVPIENIAYEACKLVYDKELNVCDIKNNIRIEKILGGNMLQSGVLHGIIINKDIIHPQMRKRIEDPRIVILDTPLEYKKGESQTSYEFKNKDEFTRALEIEEQQIRNMCQYILDVKPDVVVTEKGIYVVRLSKATGATIVNRLEDLDDKHVGTKCQLFEYIKHGEEYYSQFIKCIKPKSCSVIIRGPTRDIMNELERNFYDAIKVTRNLIMSPKLVPGGGCVEMNISKN